MKRRSLFCALAFAIVFAFSSISDAEGVLGSSATAPPASTAGLAKYARSGQAQIIGKAEFTTKLFGDVIFAHQRVHLLPLTDYSWWFVNRMAYMLNAKKPSIPDYPNDLAFYNRATTTDENGNYSFDNIPPGDYLIDFFTDYESDTSRVENNTVYSTNEDDFPSSTTT